eukprot:TRINITY_DN3134_c0_g1_i9.p1 TRINITY_DN3134_c0_g1~~TRINITY_DN3134_c0_g1_i9.p1  ORF type:complete len:907 (+),score=438.83 TRINITY_DN3134_c0_g1_i9:97-2817(+)
MSDGSKYFQTTKKGEIHEFKEDLNSTNREKIKEAVKKVIAAMTVGKDVSMLFTDVIKSMQTEDIELKKLIYLYIINYARTQPEKAILVVNTLQKDAAFPNPLVRALAIRTMGCLRVDRITEYLFGSLGKALADKDPYVRKTAAVCTAKLYDINPELVAEQGFIDTLRELISDNNPMVVANAVAALAEIAETSNTDVFKINSAMLQKLLTALNECTEWGQVFILDSLAQFEPSPEEAERIVERVTPRLAHANSAVVMSAIKVCIKYMDIIQNGDSIKLLCRKLAPPLVTLLSAEPEVQYVALRNIHLIVQRRPEILAHEVRVFFCKYNDPIYVKMEKLEIMIKLASDKNIDQVLMEFKEYATEVDIDFVRKAVRAIGRCAIKLERAAERCISVLLELISTKVNFVVQEAVVVIKDIFRKYPNRYESIIADLCENLDNLDEPEAKASMVWIIGEYAERIDNAAELLEQFIENFAGESPQVQLQLLTSTVKLFLKKPNDAKDLVQRVLNLATENSDNPDLRDRGFVYWRLLSSDPEAAKQVVLAQRPTISDDTYQLDPQLLDVLIANIATLASVYHKPPDSFVKGGRTVTLHVENEDKGEEEEGEKEEEEEVVEEEEVKGEEEESSSSQDQGDILDLIGLGAPSPAPPSNRNVMAPPSNTPSALPPSDFDSDFGFGATPAAASPYKLVLPSAKGNGLQVSSYYVRRDGQLFLELKFENYSQQPLANFALRINPQNFAGLNSAAPLRVGSVVPVNGSATASVPLVSNGALAPNAQAGLVQCALKTELGVVYFNDNLPPHLLFEENGRIEGPAFVATWKQLGNELEQRLPISNLFSNDFEAITRRLEPYNVFYTAKRQVENLGLRVYYCAKLRDVTLLIELTLGANNVAVCKSPNPELSLLGLQSVVNLLQ